MRLVCTRLPVRNATCFWLVADVQVSDSQSGFDPAPMPSRLPSLCRSAGGGRECRTCVYCPLQWPRCGLPNARYAPARRWMRWGPSPRPAGFTGGGSGSRGAGGAPLAPPSTLPRPWTVQHCPAALADLITRRVWSHLWALDETAWQTDVQSVVDALRARPDPDRPRPAAGRMTVTVLQRA